MRHNCCYKCERRTMNCHSTCEDYHKLQKANEERAKAIRKAKDKNNLIDGYVSDQKSRQLKGFRYDGRGNKI